MFRHKHKHPAFKALRDTVAFVVLCAALEWYVSHTDGAEAATAFRTVWPTLAVYCAGGALLVYCAGAVALPLRVSALFSAMGMALQVSLHPANANELKIFCLLSFVGCICTALVFALLRVMPQTVVYTFCIITSVVSFLFLRIFSKPINSTWAWVSLGGHSFQLTEALKLILVIGFSAAVTNDAWNEGVRFRAALLLLAVYAGGFFVLNELGTLLVCLLDCGVMALLYCSIKHTLSLVAFGTLTGGRVCVFKAVQRDAKPGRAFPAWAAGIPQTSSPAALFWNQRFLHIFLAGAQQLSVPIVYHMALVALGAPFRFCPLPGQHPGSRFRFDFGNTGEPRRLDLSAAGSFRNVSAYYSKPVTEYALRRLAELCGHRRRLCCRVSRACQFILYGQPAPHRRAISLSGRRGQQLHLLLGRGHPVAVQHHSHTAGQPGAARCITNHGGGCIMMNRRLFLRLFLALCSALGLSGSVVLLLERLGLLDSAQRPQIEAQRAEFEKAARKANTIEGAIVSRDGIPFTSASEPGKPALVTALCYSSLVGYRTSTSSSGLRREFGDTLYYAREEGGGTADSLVMTICAELQQIAYDLVKGQGRGVCCVANARTGEVYALASCHGDVEFDANHFSQNFSLYTETEGYLLPPWLDVNPPGSVAKLLTSTAALEAGVDLTYEDSTGEYKGIRTASRAPGGSLDLYKAARTSNNPYFAVLADRMSLSDLLRAQEAFGINQSFLRLGTSVLPAESTLTADSARSEARLQAIGQGGLSVSPLTSMAWLGAVATGELTTLRIADHFEHTLPDGSTEETPLPEAYEVEHRSLNLRPETLTTLQDVFSETAKSYGLALSGNARVFGKTGTAQVGTSGLYTIYLAFSMVYPDGNAYEAVLMREKSSEMSSVLKPLAKQLLAAIDRLHPAWEETT